MDVCCFECVTGARLGRHSRFLGRVAVAFGFFTSDGRNDGGDGVLGWLTDRALPATNNQYTRSRMLCSVVSS